MVHSALKNRFHALNGKFMHNSLLPLIPEWGNETEIRLIRGFQRCPSLKLYSHCHCIFAESLSSRSAELSDVVNVNWHGSHYLPYQGKISISKPIVLVGRLVWLVKIPEKTFPKCSYDTINPMKNTCMLPLSWRSICIKVNTTVGLDPISIKPFPLQKCFP